MVTTAEYQHIVASQMSEKEWQAQVIELAHTLGYVTYHTWNSQHSAKGFPDNIMIRPPRLIVSELKTERGKVSRSQRLWIDAFRSCGIEAYIWKPSDWDEVVATLQGAS